MLLAGLIEFSPVARKRGASRIMAAVAEGDIKHPQTAWHCCLEFYAVSTRLPEEFRLSPQDALLLMKEEIFARFDIIQIPKEEWLRFFEAAVAQRAAGGRIYDAHIAEAARLAGAKTVVTENTRHFTELTRYGIRVVNAEKFMEEK